MAHVQFERVSKSFGSKAPAVHDLSLDVANGELLVLLGPSGSGKTTVLRLLAGLETPDVGDIRIDGRSVLNLEPKDRDLALVFQSHALYPHMTVRDNMLYPLKVRHLTGAERTARVEATAALLGIDHLLERKTRQLSGGEQQRVALGRAIIREPRAFLMDEPLSSLDARLRQRMRADLRALQRKLGVTTLFVTHDQAEAMSLADRVAVLYEGRLQQLATPDHLYRRPANLFVAQFIGNPPMNVLSVEVDDGAIIAEGRWRLPLPVWHNGTFPSTMKVGVRPEAIAVNVMETAGAQPVQVELSELLGNEVIVSARIGSVLVKARTTPDVQPRMGQTVYLSVPPTGMRLFDGTTGRAIGI